MDTTSVPKLIEAIKKVWCLEHDDKYFKDPAHTMKNKVKYVLEHKGDVEVTK